MSTLNTEEWFKQAFTPEPVEIDYWGGCPQCRRNDGCLNSGRTHWYVCHEHKARWCVGSNLFDSWRHEDEAAWRQNDEILLGYEEVKPLHPILPEASETDFEDIPL